MPSAQDAHNIGRRADILKNYNASAITSYLAEEDKSAHFIETPFRSFNLALLDNLSAEYAFLTEFFSTDTYQQMSKRCSAIFEPTFTIGQNVTNDLVSTSYDCLGILLCIRLNQSFAFELQRRKVPVAESYLNGINMILWPRLQVAMDAHSESIKQLATNISARSAASKLSFTGTSADASKLGTAPHYLTQKVSQFLYGILAISQDSGDDEPVANSLRRLRGEYDSFLQKASKAAGADPKKRDRFLGNNYALLLAIIADAQGKLAIEQKTHFEELTAKLGT
jgi:vacuolar protein sorting-associated protein 52